MVSVIAKPREMNLSAGQVFKYGSNERAVPRKIGGKTLEPSSHVSPKCKGKG